MVYQSNPEVLPDSSYVPGDLKHVVPGNECRLLDRRRTPLRVLDVNRASGLFVVEVVDFEDTGARWELPLEDVGICQFAHGSAEASDAEVADYAQIVSRLDQPLTIEADPSCRANSEARIASLRREVGTWLQAESAFLASGAPLDTKSRTGDPALWNDLRRYMTANDLWTVESAFAVQYVSNPASGELVKGHRIVLAELGLAPFEGKQVRNPDLFAGSWSKRRRAEHVLHRLAFMRELLDRLGHSSVVLYRGLSFSGQRQARRNNSFTSATFNLEVAMDHFCDDDPASTCVLLRQPVPVEKLFMSYLETEQMNRQYKEAEAVLLHDAASDLF